MAQFGSFEGPIDVRFDDGGRKLILLSDVKFVDPHHTVWTAKKGAKVDGASIPKGFWSIIGGPLEGKYRDASVIHDYYCDHHDRTWKATHRVFYNAMRARKVDEVQAKVMYWAVFNFGPRWPEPGTESFETFNIKNQLRTQAPIHRAIVANDYSDVPSVAAIVDRIRAENPSLDELETLHAAP